jgi:hypothetical protein
MPNSAMYGIVQHGAATLVAAYTYTSTLASAWHGARCLWDVDAACLPTSLRPVFRVFLPVVLHAPASAAAAGEDHQQACV